MFCRDWKPVSSLSEGSALPSCRVSFPTYWLSLCFSSFVRVSGRFATYRWLQKIHALCGIGKVHQPVAEKCEGKGWDDEFFGVALGSLQVVRTSDEKKGKKQDKTFVRLFSCIMIGWFVF